MQIRPGQPATLPEVRVTEWVEDPRRGAKGTHAGQFSGHSSKIWIDEALGTCRPWWVGNKL